MENIFLSKLPKQLSYDEFMNRIKQTNPKPADTNKMDGTERQRQLMAINNWCYPFDYMYCIYQTIFQAIETTYQAKNYRDISRQIQILYFDLCKGENATEPFAAQAYSGSFLGCPGVGKTQTIKRCLEMIPQVISHPTYGGKNYSIKQVLYLSVECPNDCSVKSLIFNILLALDMAIGTSYFEECSKMMKSAASTLATKLKIICLNHNVGILVIDEIQNIIRVAERNGQTKALVKFLVELTNDTAIGILFCGTLEAERLFLQQEHLKRRTRGLHILPLKYDRFYRDFIEDLWKYQTVLHREKPTEQVAKQLYALSGGIPFYIVNIFREAVRWAIYTGEERINTKIITLAIKRMSFEIPELYDTNGTSISDIRLNKMYNQAEEELPEEQETVFVSKRGRPKSHRDKKDLLSFYEQRQSADMGELLFEIDLIERMECYL